MMDYTVDDYNVTIFRGDVLNGYVLNGVRKYKGKPYKLDWREEKAYKKNQMQKKASRKERYELHKYNIDTIKLARGCEVCGFSAHRFPKKFHAHIAMLLEYDHIDPTTKKYNVCDMKGNKWEKIKEEIDKCRVVCKVCHCKHTGKQNEREHDE